MPSLLHPPHLVSGLLLVAALVGFGLMRFRMRGLAARQRAAGGERWWYSSSVDLVNLAGVLAAAAGHRGLGLTGPQALLWGFVSCLLIYGLEYLLARRGVPGGVRLMALLLCALAAALPSLLAPGWVSRGLQALDRTLYGG